MDASPDGRIVAVGGQDGLLRVFEATSGELRGVFPAPEPAQQPLTTGK